MKKLLSKIVTIILIVAVCVWGVIHHTLGGMALSLAKIPGIVVCMLVCGAGLGLLGDAVFGRKTGQVFGGFGTAIGLFIGIWIFNVVLR